MMREMRYLYFKKWIVMKAIQHLSEILNEYSPKLRVIGEEEFSRKPSPSKWSKKEILGHLIDSAANNHQRFIRTQYEDIPSIKYDQDKWVALNNWQQWSIEMIIEFWIIYNRRIIEVVKNIPTDKLSLLCNTGKENFTLEYLIDDYVKHMEHHLRQIFDI